ncbi:MAG: hypothetical protein AAFQ57_16115, partial [Cyanobacteria bacterium J06626_14]
MSSLPILLIIFVVSIAALVKASDVFTDAAEKLGLAIGLPKFIVGVTIVSIGTSLPELISSLFGVFQDATEVHYRNYGWFLKYPNKYRFLLRYVLQNNILRLYKYLLPLRYAFRLAYDSRVLPICIPLHHDSLQYQWYKDGIALIGETSAQLNIRMGEGRYQVRILSEE